MTQPFIPAANVVQLNALYTHETEPCENVFYFQGTAAWTQATITSLLAQYVAWEQADMLSARSNATALTRVTGRDLTTQNGLIVESTAGLPLAGTNISGPLPGNVTIAISHRTGLSGRSFRGRTYMIGLSTNQITGNFLNSAQVTALQSRYSDLLSGTMFTANGAKLVCVSRQHNNAPRVAAVVTPITAITIEPTLDSQRRRLPGHNRHR